MGVENLFLSKPFYEVPTELKGSQDAGIRCMRDKEEFKNDDFIWVKVGSLSNGLFMRSNVGEYKSYFKDEDAANALGEILSMYNKEISLYYKRFTRTSFWNDWGNTITYCCGVAAAVTALVGWWWFSRAK